MAKRPVKIQNIVDAMTPISAGGGVVTQENVSIVSSLNIKSKNSRAKSVVR